MFKLILVFGVWINPQQIDYMYDYRHGCYMKWGESSIQMIENKTCDQVAEEINKQMEK